MGRLAPVILPASQRDSAARLPAGNTERSGANRRAGKDLAEGGDTLGQGRSRAEIGRGDGREEGSVRLGSGDHERRFVREIDALHFLPAECAERAELAILGEFPGSDEVLAGKSLSVVVAHFLAQHEGVGQSVVADREALGESGAQPALGRVAEEPVHYPFQDIEGSNGTGQPRVQRVGLARRPDHEATAGAWCTSRGGRTLGASWLVALVRGSLGANAGQCRDQSRARRAEKRLTAVQRQARTESGVGSRESEAPPFPLRRPTSDSSVMREEARPS